jgi:hypothetical protein
MPSRATITMEWNKNLNDKVRTKYYFFDIYFLYLVIMRGKEEGFSALDQT